MVVYVLPTVTELEDNLYKLGSSINENLIYQIYQILS